MTLEELVTEALISLYCKYVGIEKRQGGGIGACERRSGASCSLCVHSAEKTVVQQSVAEQERIAPTGGRDSDYLRLKVNCRSFDIKPGEPVFHLTCMASTICVVT